jgi:protocatechuate 3,4-dioxygenase beta subunit
MAVGLGAAAPVFALTLSGTVANDTNGNGVLDPTDAPLAGISVTLQPSGGGVTATTTTAANGTYSFPGLAANNYTVSIGSATGLINETPASVTVALTSDRNDINFLFVAPGLIGGRVISDLNGNGIAEPTEPGIPGVSVDLNRINNLGQATLIATITTGSDGTFFFPIQPAGTYTVVAHSQAGVVATGANAGSSGTAVVVDPNTIRVVLNGNQSAPGLRFSERLPQTAGISGFVLDNTGKPLANVVVELRDASQNLLASTMTDATGAYFFSSVAAGATYVVRPVPPSGFVIKSVSPTAPATALGSSGIQITNFSQGTLYANNNFTLGPSSVVSPETPGSANAITGLVINDLNGNGMFNAGEPGLAGATLSLVTTTGISYGTMVTGPSGSFTFVNLPAADYILTRTNPAGYVSTGVQPGVGGTSLSLDTIRIHVTGTSNLYSGHLFLASTGTVPPPTGTGLISGSVFQDVDGNALVNVPPDQPIQGVQILLQNNTGNTLQQFFTDVNGAWAFSNLAAGTYRVVQVVPANFTAVNAFPAAGGFATSATTMVITIPSGGDSSGNNFLDTASVVSPTVGTLSGSVFRDNNLNGIIDAGDTPFQGITIQLAVLGGPFFTSTVTDVNGAWAFGNLPPGSYQVRVGVPAGFASVGPTTVNLTVTAGFNNGNNNFLLQPTVSSTGTISGSVFQDQNGNGLIDIGTDTLLSGVTVVLQNSFGGFLGSFITDANGAWAFSGLAPGTYRVVVQVPASFAAVNSFPGPGGVGLSATTLQVTTSGGVSGNNNFLLRSTVVSPTVGTLSGTVFRDVNGDGLITPGIDQPVPGVTLQLAVFGGPFFTSTVTDVNGAWAFGNLPPGTYVVRMLVPSGYVSVGPTQVTLTVFAGVNNGNNNFLLQLSGPPPGANTISGFAIRDQNLSGNPNSEPGLAGMLVVLRDQFSNPIASVVTDVTGAFSFSGLAGGTYILTATPPAGLHSTNAIPGQGGVRLSASSIRVTTTLGVTSYASQLFLAGP